MEKEIQINRPFSGLIRGVSNIVLGKDLKVGDVCTYCGELTAVTGTPENPDQALTGILHSEGERQMGLCCK